MRLDKFLAETGLGTRTEVKALLKKKQITVNSKLETSPKVQVDENHDEICYQGQVLYYEKFVYYLLNKPQGVISATEDRKHKTVLTFLDDSARNKRVFPVGRLDRDTRGLLLLTNNGALAHIMLSPKQHVAKVYQATVAGIMTADDVLAFENGISLKDHQCQPAKLEILETNQQINCSLVRITLQEGKFHQVKRMVQACGKEVTDLKRLRMGPLVLPNDLKPGDWRRLTEDELASLSAYNVVL